MLGADALVEDEGTYKPDFSAHAGSERLRCVRISKASFDTITSMSRQEGEAPPVLRIEADSENAAAAVDDGTVDGISINTAVAAGNGNGNGGGSGGGSYRKSSVKPRAFSDEGARHSITRTGSGGGERAAGGTPGARISLSSPKKRGVPSGASFKILQAATGVAVIPSATTPTQDTTLQPADKPLETQARPSGLEAGAGVDTLASEDEGAGISLVTTTAIGMAPPPPSTRVAGSDVDVDVDVESGGGPQQQEDAGGADDDAVRRETQKTARI